MASSDWTDLNDIPNITSVERGVTNGIARPTGGGSFVYGFNTLVATEGCSALRASPAGQSGFDPTSANKGGRIRGAIQKGSSAGTTGYTPFFFLGLQGPSVNDLGYLVGFTNENPSKIAVRKGALNQGIPAVAPGTSGILARSSDTFAIGAWVHLQIDWIVNPNGDVILVVNQNTSLAANGVTGARTWATISGLATAFVDDTLHVNSGSAPYTSGRMGFGLWANALNRRGYFDHIEVLKQD